MNLCEFSKSLLQCTRSLKEAGLYDKELSTANFKTCLTSAGVDLESYKGNDRKKLAQLMITHVLQKCSCLSTIVTSKHFQLTAE